MNLALFIYTKNQSLVRWIEIKPDHIVKLLQKPLVASDGSVGCAQRFMTHYTREEAKLKIFVWIEVFYNRQRIHSTLDYKTPVDFEKTKTVS